MMRYGFGWRLGAGHADPVALLAKRVAPTARISGLVAAHRGPHALLARCARAAFSAVALAAVARGADEGLAPALAAAEVPEGLQVRRFLAGPGQGGAAASWVVNSASAGVSACELRVYG